MGEEGRAWLPSPPLVPGELLWTPVPTPGVAVGSQEEGAAWPWLPWLPGLCSALCTSLRAGWAWVLPVACETWTCLWSGFQSLKLHRRLKSGGSPNPFLNALGTYREGSRPRLEDSCCFYPNFSSLVSSQPLFPLNIPFSRGSSEWTLPRGGCCVPPPS